MKKTKLALLVIAAVIVACIFSPAASAADVADGKEVHKENYVVIGETGLNFTSFNPGPTSYMAYTGTDTQNWFPLSSVTAVAATGITAIGTYFLVDVSQSPLVPDYLSSCRVISPESCELKFVD